MVHMRIHEHEVLAGYYLAWSKPDKFSAKHPQTLLIRKKLGIHIGLNQDH